KSDVSGNALRRRDDRELGRGVIDADLEGRRLIEPDDDEHESLERLPRDLRDGPCERVSARPGDPAELSPRADTEEHPTHLAAHARADLDRSARLAGERRNLELEILGREGVDSVPLAFKHERAPLPARGARHGVLAAGLSAN